MQKTAPGFEAINLVLFQFSPLNILALRYVSSNMYNLMCTASSLVTPTSKGSLMLCVTAVRRNLPHCLPDKPGLHSLANYFDIFLKFTFLSLIKSKGRSLREPLLCHPWGRIKCSTDLGLICNHNYFYTD